MDTFIEIILFSIYTFFFYYIAIKFFKFGELLEKKDIIKEKTLDIVLAIFYLILLGAYIIILETI
tara:strand:+ start:434 stop:628 length:195 start_codon:yes stop_codon:yes gene_type:complete